MPAPENRFKSALADRRIQIGLWSALASPNVAELCGAAGFDWLVIDAEHAPYDLAGIVAQLRAAELTSAHPVIRPPVGETWIIKQLLDIGVQTLLVPMVESAEQARKVVSATRYPPEGVRGVGAALARASAFGRTGDYLLTANEQICVLMQVESVSALARIEEIAQVPGVDGIFIGPADLAADMGFAGRPGSAEVQSAIEDGLRRIVACGCPAGILTSDEALAQRYLDLGATFVAVGNDVSLLTSATSALAGRFRNVRNRDAGGP